MRCARVDRAWSVLIVVDSSVWIGHFRDLRTSAVARLRAIADVDTIIVGDLVLLEVLQGTRDERHADAVERRLRTFDVRAMLDDRRAVEAARNFRSLRATGITVRKTVDLIIATFCLTGDHVLLHDDRDFDLMVGPLGLKVY